MPITIDLRNLPTVSNPVFYPLHRDHHRNLVLMGGAGSGKSFFTAQKKVVRAVREPGHHIIAFRKVGRTLRTSVWAQFREVIRQFDQPALWQENKTEMTLTFLPNGSVLRCMGMDDPEKLKSIVGMTSAWMEEATEFQRADYEQINLRMRGRYAHSKQIVLTFNPVSVTHWLKPRFFDAPAANTRTLVTTYRDNNFCDDEYGAELEALKERDPQLGAVYADGEWGILTGLIYGIWPNAEPPANLIESIYGLDFGFNNPMALIRADIADNGVYLTEECYETGLTTEDLVQMLPALGVPKTAPIYCDAAEPDRVQTLANAGYWALPASKGQGSVRAGIDFLKSQQIYTRPGNTNLNKELATYKWAVDKDGNPMDEPVKFMDHALDAVRYALYTHLSQREDIFVGGGLDVSPE